MLQYRRIGAQPIVTADLDETRIHANIAFRFIGNRENNLYLKILAPIPGSQAWRTKFMSKR